MLSHFNHIQLFMTPWSIATRLLCPWDSPGKNIGVGCYFLLQGIFPTQGSNLSQWRHLKFHMNRGNSKDLIEVSVVNQGSSLVAQLVKNLPAMQETWVQPLGLEDPLEKGMATHSVSAWRIPWTEETGRLQPMGLQRVGHSWATNMSLVSSDVSAF